MQNKGGHNAADYKDNKEERTLDPYSLMIQIMHQEILPKVSHFSS